MTDKAPAPPSNFDQFMELFRNPAARVYVAIATGGLAMTVLILFLIFNSSLGAALVLSFGILAIALRWTALPVLIVVLVGYFVFAPFGFPATPNVPEIPGSQFRLPDLLLMASVLTYLIGQFRLYSVIQQAIPFDAGSQFVRKSARPPVRPAVAITDSELGRLFTRVAMFVVAGQLLWLSMTWLQVDFREVPPLISISDDTPLSYDARNREGSAHLRQGGMSSRWSRSFIALGIFVAIAVAMRLSFWFWRHSTLSHEQAKLLLTDMQWSEHRREIDRQEKWRAWMVAKLTGKGTNSLFGCGSLFFVLGLPLILMLAYRLLMMALGWVP